MQLGAKTASFWTIISYNFVSQKGICYIRVFLCPFSFVSNQHPEQQKKNFSKNNKTEYPDEDALQKTDRKRTKVALWSHKWAEMIQFWVFSLFDAKFSVIFYRFSLNGVPLSVSWDFEAVTPSRSGEMRAETYNPPSSLMMLACIFQPKPGLRVKAWCKADIINSNSENYYHPSWSADQKSAKTTSP